MIRRAVPVRRLGQAIRCYHSYPDPSEKPVITTSLASPLSTKQQKDFALAEKFRLDKRFPDTPAFRPIVSSKIPPTLSTKMENGLTIATQEMPGLMSSIAFVVKMGSAFETPEFTGSTHFLELSAFKSTFKRQHLDLIAEVESLGGQVQCIATRENILYFVDVLRPNLEKALDILADTVLSPRFPEEELEDTMTLLEFQREELASNVLSRDLVQQAAYVGQPLGNRAFCPLELAPQITAEKLNKFRSKFLFGDNCVISASGVVHDEFVRLVRNKFAALPKGDPSTVSHAISKFTGGLVTEERVLKEPYIKMAMAYEVGGWKDDSVVAVCVLQSLLGGGKSFSAGGPGKGMYTRLYTEVLNQYYWAEEIESFVNIHNDAGLLGIDGACTPDNLPNLVRAIVDQFSKLALFEVTPVELNRAKNMLKSSMMMQLESRLVVAEDIARQFITYGKRESTEVTCAKIDAVTASDLMKIAAKMIEQPPAISCVGEGISHLPAYQDIRHFAAAYVSEMKKKVKSQ